MLHLSTSTSTIFVFLCCMAMLHVSVHAAFGDYYFYFPCTKGDEFGCPHKQALHFGYEVSEVTIPGAVALDLACGEKPRNPFKAETLHCVDVVAQLPGVIEADLVIEPIPFANNSVNAITAYDFLEHIPRVIYINGKRRNPFVEIMNEIWRVLKPGGVFFAVTPCFPYENAFVDPTHVNYVTAATFDNYFTKEKRWAAAYGFTGAFENAPHRLAPAYETYHSKHLHTFMVKVPVEVEELREQEVTTTTAA
jgi:SAM-dependent methyltransferase